MAACFIKIIKNNFKVNTGISELK